MTTLCSRRAFALGLTLALAASTARASTWIVDAAGGPGANYTDLPPAIAAAAPADVLIVRPGSYSSFVLDKGLTLVADPGANVLGGITVQNVTTFRALLVNLACDTLVIADCPRVVIAQGLTVRGTIGAVPTQAVDVANATDVRFQRLSVPGNNAGIPYLVGQDAMRVTNARVELVRSNLRGRDGYDTANSPTRPHGGHALRIGPGGNVHAALSTLRGGEGGDNPSTTLFQSYGGDGGDAARLTAADSVLLLTGVPTDTLSGGFNGYSNECAYDGLPGTGVRVVFPSASARVSGATLLGAGYFCDGSLGPTTIGPVTVPATPDPTLEMLPPVSGPGAACTMVVHAAPGTDVRLRLGRRPIVEDLPASIEDRLVEQLRSWGLGLVPASGEVTFPFTLPSTSPIGALLAFQAFAVDPSTGTEFTASWPVVFR
ncbi:MAG: hypothetical protein HZA53_15325 [Planctomycetes bacterium]|nr:hypothetical protein [Planctomycetota bacterium]